MGHIAYPDDDIVNPVNGQDFLLQTTASNPVVSSPANPTGEITFALVENLAIVGTPHIRPNHPHQVGGSGNRVLDKEQQIFQS